MTGRSRVYGAGADEVCVCVCMTGRLRVNVSFTSRNYLWKILFTYGGIIIDIWKLPMEIIFTYGNYYLGADEGCVYVCVCVCMNVCTCV